MIYILAAAVGGMCAIGYLAGEQKEEQPKGGDKDGDLQRMMAQLAGMGGMPGGMGGMPGGMGGMPGMGGMGGMPRGMGGMPDESSEEDERDYAQVESDSDEDSLGMTSIAKRPTPKTPSFVRMFSYSFSFFLWFLSFWWIIISPFFMLVVLYYS